MPITGDGSAHASPWSVSWTDGLSKTVTVPESQTINDVSKYVFTTWSGKSSSTSHSISISTGSVTTGTYTANYKKQFGLGVAINPENIGTISGSGWYDQGTTVRLTAPTFSGYTFVKWQIDGTNENTNPTVDVTMNTYHLAVAVYSATSGTHPYTFQTTDNAMSITGDGSAHASPWSVSWTDGLSKTVTVPESQTINDVSKYVFTTWSGKSSSTSHSISISTGSVTTGTYTANYKKQFGLGVAINPENIGTISGSGWYDQGTTVRLTAPTFSGYTFVKWQIDGTNENTNPTIDITMNTYHLAVAVYNPTPSSDTWGVIGTIPLSGNALPHHIAINGGKAYVSRSGGQLSVINLSTNETITTIQFSSYPGSSPGYVAVSGNKAYVTLSNLGFNGQLAIINTDDNTVSSYIPVGANPWGIAVFNNRIYVTNTGGSATVKVIDRDTNSIIATIPVGKDPSSIAIDPTTRKAYVTNSNSLSNSVSVIDTDSNSVIGTIAMNRPSKAVAISGNRAYITTDWPDGSVEVIDISTDGIIASIPVDRNSDSAGIAASGSYVFATIISCDVVNIIDIATNSIVTTLNVGDDPLGIAIDSSTNKVYVANGMDKTITIIGQIPATPIPVANFTAIPISGTAPLTVQFNDLSTNSPTTWNWSFGDGSSSTLQNPSHTYTSAGTFNVALNATNSAGSNTFVRTNYITVSSSETYVFITKWGSGGPGDGQFNGPWGVSVDPPGNVYISDNSNYRIQKFSSNGSFITKWGSKGSGDGQSYGFSGIAVDPSGNVYVTDPENNRIQKFSSTGTFLIKWGYYGNNYGAFYNPRSVAVDPSGNIYVVDTWNHRIQKFNSSGTFLATWGSSGFDNGQFYHPYGVAVDSSGDVYVADRSNHRIQKFSSTGTFLTKWGSEGSGDGQFSNPYGVAVDSSSNIYVADTENHRIQKFSSTGKFIAKWGSSGSDNGQFDYPISVAADTSGNVYVSDSNNNRIQKFALSSANPPVANFYGSPTTGSAPLTVAFYDQSTNTPASWSWSFGDGSSSTLQNPSHTYTSAEAYTVVLTATNSAGSNITTKTNYITVNAPRLTLWNMTVNITSGTYNQNVIMGSAASATRGYDVGFDVAMPPDPPGAKKIVYFSINDALFDHLSTDYKPPVNATNTVEYWTLYIKSDGMLQVSWDTTLIGNPDLTFMWNDGTKTVNMRSVTNTTLPAGENYVNLSASTTATRDLPLKGGWNLVSVPFTHAQYVVPVN
ncbi:MAG: PKD domain-containing protein, partial [Methanoregula sp.]|nr:PKD domain-containing protein [Methanoregula sp.]